MVSVNKECFFILQTLAWRQQVVLQPKVPLSYFAETQTASKLLQQFGTLEGILADQSSSTQSIRQEETLLRQNQVMITLMKDAPISYEEDILQFRPFSETEVSSVFKEYDFFSFLKEISGRKYSFIVHKPGIFQETVFSSGIPSDISSNASSTGSSSATIAQNEERLHFENQGVNFSSSLSLQKEQSEGSGNGNHSSGVISLSAEVMPDFVRSVEQDQKCFLFMVPEKDRRNLYLVTPTTVFSFDLSSATSRPEWFSNGLFPLLSNTAIQKIFFDAKEIGHCLPLKSLSLLSSADDLQLAFFLDQPNQKQYTLKDFQNRYQEVANTEETESFPYFLMLSEAEKLIRHIQETEEASLYRDTELPFQKVLYDMESEGICVSREYLLHLESQLKEQIAQTENDIFATVGQSFNLASPKQLSFILFEKMNLPTGRKNKTGYSTDAEVLESLKPFSPVVEKILLHRELSKMLNTYATGLLKVVDSSGMIHTTYLQAGPATGRIASLSVFYASKECSVSIFSGDQDLLPVSYTHLRRRRCLTAVSGAR